MTDENHMFQIEIVENETVYACNICDQGFAGSDKVKKHITEVHQDIINHILTKVKDSNADNVADKDVNANNDLDKGENEEINECAYSGNNEGTMNINTENEMKEDDVKFTFTLWYERLEGNN